MWNHRDVNDKIQAAIETIIKNEIEGMVTEQEEKTKLKK